ncbi:MAG: aminotransferase class I/II-fold pyridoxal phosphate-dependent enzyme, partial [Bacteroidia bacterium]|nr:aminotransferase class I/II-fold pyridoxal phosphate-dependent enzyme [Bacteroidia bacterium]
MTAKAQAAGALNLAQGFPGYSPPPRLIELAAQAMRDGYNQYAPPFGLAELRRLVADLLRRYYGYVADPETEITITSGATEALFLALTAVTRSDDEIILLEPCYDSYAPTVLLAGGIPVCVPLDEKNGFCVDWERVKKRINRKTKAVVLNSPHNPTGAVLTEADMFTLASLLCNNDIVVISDEVYEHIVFDGFRHESVLRYPELASRAFMIGSFGKTLHVTGWKTGYVVAPPPYTAEVRKIHSQTVFASATPFQKAITDYFALHPDYADGLKSFFQAKRDLFDQAMKKTRFAP